MAVLTPTGLETITYGQQGWNAIITANMQRLNQWIGTVLALVNDSSKTNGAIPVWNAQSNQWTASTSLQEEIDALKARVTALENKPS